MILDNSSETILNIEIATLVVLGTFVASSISYLIYSIVVNCKDSGRKKTIERNKQDYIKYREDRIKL